MTDPYDAAARSAARLTQASGVVGHDVAVVLGSGWRAAADALGDVVAEVPLSTLGGFPPPSVPGHVGVVRSVARGRRRVLVFLGRVHLYEGHRPAVVVHGVRTAAAAGCRTVVLTNAAGGLAPGLRVGQPVLIRDHLNLTGASPLAGPPPAAGAPSRFADLGDLYAGELRARARALAPELVEGTYAALLGPHYETPAEVRMLATLGADLVGMSTALEAIAAHHLGVRVLGLSLVTNIAAGLSPVAVVHEEVVAVGAAAAAEVGQLLARLIDQLP